MKKIEEKKVVTVNCPYGFQSQAGRARFGLTVDSEKMTIQVTQMSDKTPGFREAVYAILADDDTRYLIRKYSAQEERVDFRIGVHEGSSGCRDVWVEVFEALDGGFINRVKRPIVHETCYGKAEFTDKPMFIGDFVEAVAYLGMADNMDKAWLMEESGAKFSRALTWADLSGTTSTAVARILPPLYDEDEEPEPELEIHVTPEPEGVDGDGDDDCSSMAAAACARMFS